MPLVILNRVPTNTSTFKSSTTRASMPGRLPASKRVQQVLPSTTKGVTPSACCVCWDVFMMETSMLWATEALIVLVLAPVSKVS